METVFIFLGAGLPVMAGVAVLTVSIMSGKDGHKLVQRSGSVAAVGLALGSVFGLAYLLPEDAGWRLFPFLAGVTALGVALGITGHRVIEHLAPSPESDPD